MKKIIVFAAQAVLGLGDAVIFLGGVFRAIFEGKIRFRETLTQLYTQGPQIMLIIALTSLASGVVLALQGHVMLVRFGAKEFISHLVAISLVRELSPVFTALFFSGIAGSRITAELGTMNVNDQILATRTMGVDPVEFLVVPRFLACLIAIPILTVVSEIVGIYGGYWVGVYEARIPGSFYWSQTLQVVRFIDFFSGFAKALVFAVLVSWICCYQGYRTTGGSLGVGKYTTRAVALSIIWVVLSNTVLTKLILMVWE
jgi:phospholipid/cholesterol/gamma-HCH transport system permease protein